MTCWWSSVDVPGALLIADLPGKIRQLTLSNPDRRNALDPPMLDALAAALCTTDDVRAWLVRGDGPASATFCAGYDLGALSVWDPASPMPDQRLGEVFDLLSKHRAPSVALLMGGAVGAGCELACACDFRVADTRAFFLVPPAKLGIVYAPRGIARVAAKSSLQTARLLMLAGRKLEAEDAKVRGLIDVLTFQGDAERQALALVGELAGNAPLALQGMKRALAGLANSEDLAALDAELDAARRASFQSDDAKEGVAAFLEKRAAQFNGR